MSFEGSCFLLFEVVTVVVVVAVIEGGVTVSVTQDVINTRS
jgi:hypothetical protein